MSPAVKRRGFLHWCWQGAAALLLPAPLRSEPELFLHPHYREQTAFDAALLKISPVGDVFMAERHHPAMARVLSGWRSSLLQSVQDVSALESSLAVEFRGSSWRPTKTRPVRKKALGLEVEDLQFSTETPLAAREFVDDWRLSLTGFTQLLAAEFQVTHIGPELETSVRYELVGTGPGFFREQRVGEWLLVWDEKYKIKGFRATKEVRSRATETIFSDVTRHAFEGNRSYEAQMLHGADYWRTVLDGASGIDIYGHNGVSVGDLHGSGFDDIYVCQPSGLPNRLYRNRGNGTFEDVTEKSGLGVLDNCACSLISDFNNDGRQDLVVVRATGPLLFMNLGDGKFELKKDAFHFASTPQGTFTGAAAADYDRDGNLDIYFCLYTYYQGTDQYRYPTPYFAAENGPPNFLMKNDGDGVFRDVTEESGLNRNNSRYSFCSAWGDYDADGWPDLYVVNDFGRKNLYRNRGDGTFSDVAAELGVEDVGAGMSVSWLGRDLYIGNMWTAAGERITGESEFQKEAAKETLTFYRKHAMGNSMLENSGGKYTDVTRESGTGMGRWAWSGDTWDFDHDGLADLYVVNGMISGPVREDLNSYFWRQVVAHSPNSAKPDSEYKQAWKAINEMIRSDYSWSGYERNVFFANNGDGSFSDISGAVGLDFLEDGRSFALADFDGDGRQEIVVKNRSAPQLRLMKNTASELPPGIAFRLQGTKSCRDAIGAEISLRSGASEQLKTVRAGSGFLSQHSKELFFGLGDWNGSISAKIRWPSGANEELTNLGANHRVWVTEGQGVTRSESFQRTIERSLVGDASTPVEELPIVSETWLLSPIAAPAFSAWKGGPRLLSFGGNLNGPQFLTLDPEDEKNSEACAVYNLLFRYIFDRHSDLPIPSSFLIDAQGQIVKVYRGKVEASQAMSDLRSIPQDDDARIRRALPFPGVAHSFDYGRNYLSLGSIFFQRGYTDTAGGFFQAALKSDPVSAEAFYGLGSVYLKQDKYPEAKECFERVTTLKASYPETTPNAWNNLGLMAGRKGDTEDAVAYFEQALKLSPEYFIALQNLGNAYRQQRRWDDARSVLERALSLKPNDAEANYSMGMVYAQTDDSAKAFQYLDRALQLRPDYPDALNNLGVLYLRTRRRDEAVASFEKCIQLAPAFDQAYLNLARVYAIEGKADKARTILGALLVQHPNNVAAKQALEQLK